MTSASSADKTATCDSPSVSLSRGQTDAPDGKSIAILMDAHLHQADLVRRPDPRFLTRLISKISQWAFPGTNSVRGKLVATDTLVDALIRYGETAAYDLFVYPEARAAASARLNLLESDGERRKKEVRINSVFDVLRGADKYRIRAWFHPIPHCDAHGGLEIAHRIRTHFASRLYPITTLFHGLAAQNHCYDIYLKLLLGPSLPCDSVICSSRASRDTARKIINYMADRLEEQAGGRVNYNGRFDLIPLCVDTSKLQPRRKIDVRSKLRLPHDAFLILYLGRISPLKADLYPFLLAFQWLVRKNSGKRLIWVLAGTEDPGYTSLLLERARDLGVAEHIRVLLNISDETKSLLLPASDVFVSPVDTLDESFGLTPVEAMACGVPQVVPDWDGYRDTVSHGETGFLIPAYWADCCGDLTDAGIVAGEEFNRFCVGQSIAVDTRQTIECLQALIDNHHLCHEMAEQSRRRALSLFSCEAVVKRYEELWAELANIALHLGPLGPETYVVNFDRLRYFDLFGNYASATITDETTLQLTLLGQEAIISNTAFPPKSLPHLDFEILDENILRRGLVKLSNRTEFHNPQGRVEQPIGECQEKMGELIRFLADSGRHPDYLRRHVMWLVKYSYLQPIFE